MYTPFELIFWVWSRLPRAGHGLRPTALCLDLWCVYMEKKLLALPQPRSQYFYHDLMILSFGAIFLWQRGPFLTWIPLQLYTFCFIIVVYWHLVKP